jgi:hypothetical protein
MLTVRSSCASRDDDDAIVCDRRQYQNEKIAGETKRCRLTDDGKHCSAYAGHTGGF